MKIVLCEKLSSIDRDYKVEHWEYQADRPQVAFTGPEDEARVIADAFVQIGYRDLSGMRCDWCGDLVVPPFVRAPGVVEHNDGTKHRYELLCQGCRN